MLWDGMWDKYEKRLARQPHKVWADLAATVIEYTRQYFNVRGHSLPVKSSILSSIDTLCSSALTEQGLSRQQKAKWESLIEKVEDDDQNTDAPGVIDLLMALEFFQGDLNEASLDDLADCLSYCYQCIFGIEILKPMKNGEAYTESELVVMERKVPACVEGVEFQAAAIRKVLGIDK